MNKYTEILGLSSEKARNLTRVYRGYARVLEKREKEEFLPYIATNYAMAGLIQVLTDPQKAKEDFFRAAQFFKQLKAPVWILYAICSNNRKGLLNTTSIIRDVELINTASLFYQQLASYYLRTTYSYVDEPGEVSSPHLSTGKMPRLDIPYEIVRKVFEESQGWTFDNKDTSAFRALILRLDELLARKQADSFHWKRLKGNIVPIEPGAIALAALFLGKWEASGGRSYELIEEFGLSSRQNVVLEIAAELIGAKHTKN